MEQVPPRKRREIAPALPILVLGLTEACWRDAEGRTARLPIAAARRRLEAGEAPALCYRPAIARRLDLRSIPSFDALELFAFLRPTQFCIPTVRGLAGALQRTAPVSLEEQAAALAESIGFMLAELADPDRDYDPQLRPVARAMAAGGWNWTPLVLAALGETAAEPSRGARPLAGLEVWRDLAEWAERAPEPPAGDIPVTPEETLARLDTLLGAKAEARPQQRRYSSALAYAFTPRDTPDAPRTILAEAGTGVGKTLGYVAPASLWAEKNEGAVWISTFTRNLQHQIDQELDRLYPDPNEKRRRVVLRKGRENYLCLLNFEEAVQGSRLRLSEAPVLGLVARWIAKTRDGAIVASDFPGWLADIVGRTLVASLTDHRSECIYAACSHYSRCFIEHSIRRAKRARLVVANHALVMVQAALAATEDGAAEDRALPARYVFDEGHHVFAAADAAFSAHLSGQEMTDLRRWIRGAEVGAARRSRARGLRARLGELVADDEAADKLLRQAVAAAALLPAEGWLARAETGEGDGPAERFLSLVRQQVYARDADAGAGYDLEATPEPLVPGLAENAAALDRALGDIMRPLIALAERLQHRLDDDADTLDTAARNRLDSLSRAIRRRALGDLAAWRAMLGALQAKTPADFVDWFAVERDFGRDRDIGMHRHWVDPTRPFVDHVLRPAHGAVITSASLRDGTGEDSVDWAAAGERAGTRHLAEPARQIEVDSPFDYATQTRLFVVRDVRIDEPAQVAAAYRELFLAAGGGALGLFTAIARLRAVHRALAPAMEAHGIPLLAQHIDGYDVSTLVDIFRAEPDACLLGTDAVRDGVDVPGRSLRLIVFDRVPWPRPDILFKARQAAFGGGRYTDRETRFRLRQGFGRLIRRADDLGVFVMLDPRLPTRLCGAFPRGVTVHRVGLAEAVAETKRLLAHQTP